MQGLDFTDEDIMKRFGARCKSLRKKTGLSAEDFAHAEGIDRAQWGKYERGQVEPRLTTILRICNALKISPAKFFSEGFD